VCRELCEARGELPPYKGGLKARILGLLDLDDVFATLLLATEARLGPVLCRAHRLTHGPP
jgi:hypothetical protein